MAFFSMWPVIALARATWVDLDPFGLCVMDHHVPALYHNLAYAC
jgi:hypothetical protein